MKTEKLINTALSREAPDLVVKNARIINVFSGEIISGDIAVTDGIIVGVGNYSGKREIDAGNRYVAPGFINAHLHVESSMVTPEVYAEEELRQGTTTIITDPHEIANVGGVDALKDMMRAAKQSCLNYYVMLPSCVPCTPFEHSGAVLNAEELLVFQNEECVLGLAEMMNSAGVLNLDETVMKKIAAFSDQMIDGHAPMLYGKNLNAYASAGIATDHESVSFEEALNKIRCGIAVLIREGSASKNLESIVKGIVENAVDTSRFAFCTDDKHLADIRKEGTIRHHIKKSVQLGLDPVQAIQMATINAAVIYGLKHIGAVACGYRADMVIFDDFEHMNIKAVLKDGIPIEELPKTKRVSYSPALLNSVNPGALSSTAFEIEKRDQYSVIQVVENQIITQKCVVSHQELLQGLADGTIRKIAVIERHKATGHYAAAYMKGYGLEHGAIAATVAHDSHNIIVVGDNDSDMYCAVSELRKINGGYTVIRDGKAVASLPLELGGLMSLCDADEFIPKLDEIIEIAYDMGVNRNIDPFITLSFMALPVLPELRITDCGLFDVDSFKFTE